MLPFREIISQFPNSYILQSIELNTHSKRAKGDGAGWLVKENGVDF